MYADERRRSIGNGCIAYDPVKVQDGFWISANIEGYPAIIQDFEGE